ncbi:MAG: hypothetical protein J7K00_05665 [Candidatus Diapherotrites archaeon]|nr:hypothetical protein [Candidatus Diapherotrites archaeon]
MKGVIYSIESSLLLLALVSFLVVASTFSFQENVLHDKEILQIMVSDALTALEENGLFEDLAFSRRERIKENLDKVFFLVNPELVYCFEFDGVVVSNGSCGFCAVESRLLADSSGVLKEVVLEAGFR